MKNIAKFIITIAVAISVLPASGQAEDRFDTAIEGADPDKIDMALAQIAKKENDS